MAMLRLRTFGGLSLTRGEQNLTGAATQRRRLAILVLLAAAGDAGLSRDKLLAYLWPESDAARARHVLNQLLYAQRRQAGADALFLGQKTLRLNPKVISSDLGDFEEAVAGGAPAAAVELYRGPFLDGFFLKDAPEFEQWVESQRARLARRCLASLRGLAEAAAAAGMPEDTIGWWRRAAELDPLDTTIALELVRALAAAGDRTGALRHARRHAEHLRSELAVAPDPRLTDLVAELKRA